MSLRILLEEDAVRVRYNDEARQVDVHVNLRDGSVIVQRNLNVSVVIEPKSVVNEEKQAPVSTVISDFSALKEQIKKEVLEILRDQEAVSEEKALSLDSILEIAQLEKERFPALRRVIEVYGAGGAKQRLALVVGVLGRLGLVKDTIVQTTWGSTTRKYCITSHGVRKLEEAANVIR